MNKVKGIALSLALVICVVGLAGQTPSWQWAVRAGGTAMDEGYDIALDSQGNQYVTGSFHGTAGFGPFTLSSSGDYDIFAAKLDPNGNWLWAVWAGGTSSASCPSIALDGAGNAYLTGYFYGSATFGTDTLTSSGGYDIFVAKLDPNGNFLWAVRAGGAYDDYSYGIALDGVGNAYLTGRFWGVAAFGPYTLTSSGNYDTFAAKLDPDSNWLWAVRAGGASNDRGSGIAVDGVGNAYLTGYFMGSVAFGPYTLISNGVYDIFAAKLDPNGNWLWAVRAGGTNYDYVDGIAVDGAGNAYLTGSFQTISVFGPYTLTSSGNDDVFAAKLDPNGNWLWAVRAGGTNVDYGYGIAVDGAGNAYLTGVFASSATFGPDTLTSSGGYDIFAAKLDSAGNFLWAARAGGASHDGGIGIAVNGTGNAWLTGSFAGSAEFSPYMLTSSGNIDIFVAKIATTAAFPSSPENLAITRSGNDILLSWDAVTLDTNNQALIPDGYRVYSGIDADPESFSLLGEVTGTSYTHNGAAADLGRHCYRVTAVKD